MGCEVPGWAVIPRPWQPHTHLSAEQPGGTTQLEDGLRILWIRLDYCRVDQSPIWAYQAAHDDPGRLPLISLSKAKQNQALSEFSKRIDEAMAVGAD
jgi:hypothetical protein